MRTFGAAVVFVVFASSLPVRAADTAAVQSKVLTALRSAKSFVVDVKMKPIVYGNKHGAWEVQTWDDHLVTGFEGDVFDVQIVSAGDGTFVMKDPLGRGDGDTLSCTYDKTTFRPLTCGNAGKTITYGRYDDPSVTIPTPAHAKRVDKSRSTTELRLARSR